MQVQLQCPRMLRVFIRGLPILNHMLVDKKILAGGAALLVSGMVVTAILGSMTPTGHPNMTEEEVLELLMQQQQNDDMGTLAGILVGVGFLLILVSFGARRRRRGGTKTQIKKPAGD